MSDEKSLSQQLKFKRQMHKRQSDQDGRDRLYAIERAGAAEAELEKLKAPIPMIMWCPECGQRHVDEGEFATKPHHTHACQHCGVVWRPAIVATCGVRFLPGFKQ